MLTFSTGSYGVAGMENFERLVKTSNSSICIANGESVNSAASDDVFDEIITTMMKTPNARVIVCFCEGKTVTKLYEATMRIPKARGHFLILGR